MVTWKVRVGLVLVALGLFFLGRYSSQEDGTIGRDPGQLSIAIKEVKVTGEYPDLVKAAVQQELRKAGADFDSTGIILEVKCVVAREGKKIRKMTLMASGGDYISVIAHEELDNFELFFPRGISEEALVSRLAKSLVEGIELFLSEEFFEEF